MTESKNLHHFNLLRQRKMQRIAGSQDQRAAMNLKAMLVPLQVKVMIHVKVIKELVIEVHR